MINVIKATEIMRKYCPETKLEIKNGADGLYLTESDIIWIGRDWHLGGLLHEITHAMLYKEDGRTGHDGVFADRLTQLVGEVFCNHISQQEKKVSLTELKDGAFYYTINGIEEARFCEVNGVPELVMPELEEVLAPVPSYNEYMSLVFYKEDLIKACKMRDKIIKKYEDIDDWWKAENQKLKELLKECKDELEGFDNISEWNEIGRGKLLTKIDEVLK